MTCNVTGTAISPNGQIKPGAKITFRRAQLDVVSQEGSFVIPDDYIIQTASDGTVDFDILPGVYDATTVAVGGRTVAFRVSVPDEPAADFADLLNASYVEIPPASVTQAQQARDEAEAFAQAAASSATEAGGYKNTALTASAQLVYPEKYGAVGDGVADDTNALQTALDFVGGLGGGIVRLSAGKKYLIDSANIVVPQDVILEGNGWPGGQRALSNYTNMPGLIVNSAYTIRLLRNSGIIGVALRRKGLTQPASYRDAVNAVAAYAGTAITIGDGTFNSGADATIRGIFGIGFNLLIDATNVERYVIEDVRGDNTNGINCDTGTDTMRISGVHFWPFLNAHQSWSINGYAITNAQDNGVGLIRITCIGHPFVTGDTARINGITGTTEAHGRWIVTVIDASTFDLQGSIFANAYVSGGTAYAWAGSRTGTGIKIAGCDGAHIQGAVVYGYDKGFHITGGSNATILSHCVTDYNPAWGDDVSIGILCDDGSFNTRIFGGFVNGSGYGVKVNSNRAESVSVYGVAISGVVRSIDLVVGSITVDGCNVSNRCHVGSAATSFRLVGSDTFNATFEGDDASAATKFVFVGDRYSTSLARLGGSQVDIGLSESGQPSGMRSRFQITSGADIRVKRRSDTIGGAIGFERPNGSAGYRLGHVGETDLFVSPISAEVSNVYIGQRAATPTTVTNSVVLIGKSVTPAPAEFYALFMRENDSAGTSVSYAGIVAASTDVTAGAAKGSLQLRTRSGAAGLENSIVITGDHTVLHSPNLRTIIDANSHFRLRSYTVATLPSAIPAGQMIYVSDLTGGAEPCHSDGANWRRFSDRTVAS